LWQSGGYLVSRARFEEDNEDGEANCIERAELRLLYDVVERSGE
jgi:hypothetical protein